MFSRLTVHAAERLKCIWVLYAVQKIPLRSLIRKTTFSLRQKKTKNNFISARIFRILVTWIIILAVDCYRTTRCDKFETAIVRVQTPPDVVVGGSDGRCCCIIIGLNSKINHFSFEKTKLTETRLVSLFLYFVVISRDSSFKRLK